MYVIRRVYEVKPGTARRVATLVQQQGAVYTDAGQRSEVRVYFNGGTVPGDNNRVYMEWTAEVIDSPYREGNVLPKDVMGVGAKVREHVISQRIEFYELMIPAKMQDE
ncbi:MAG: hypothetical protein IH960_05030 [Chloroflexi bacterium]|nr:hypothetical protein [Chloroflexota bacterium]MCH8909395.1 hypothetical protein [Chloroflexota bacterium]